MAFTRSEQFNEFLTRLFPIEKGYNDGIKGNYPRTITFQVTEDCCMKCSYCYQHAKTNKRMPFEVAKQFIDDLLEGSPKLSCYIPKESIGVILEFIGGEPLMEIDLIDRIVDYFKDKCIELHHPWATRYKISMSSNGLLYFNENVQQFIEKNMPNLSLSISIDGNKELHDSCRVDLEGKGTYDRAIAAMDHYVKKYNLPSIPSKMTIAPGNVEQLATAVISMIEHGYTEINCNTVFEEGWAIDHAKIYYKQLKLLADYIIENDLLANNDLICSVFDFDTGHPLSEENNQNWCGGTGSMLAIDCDGNIYPCLRYMPTSLGNSQVPYIIGTVEQGVMQTEETKKRVEDLQKITRRSQSTDECFYCPIASGCAWCSAYCYEVFGTANKRTTFICDMHKARVLAISYLWNTYFKNHQSDSRYELSIPDNWALEIIDAEELRMLKDLARR